MPVPSDDKFLLQTFTCWPSQELGIYNILKMPGTHQISRFSYSIENAVQPRTMINLCKFNEFNDTDVEVLRVLPAFSWMFI